MKTTITLELKTKEAQHLFTRKINGSRLFVNAVLHKINKITRQHKKSVSGAEVLYHAIQQNLTSLAKQFEADTRKYSGLIQQSLNLKNKEITVKAQFFPKIRVENQLTITLIALIEKYDHLVSMIKLLHLLGCFESTQEYYAVLKKKQKLVNQSLSNLILHHDDANHLINMKYNADKCASLSNRLK